MGKCAKNGDRVVGLNQHTRKAFSRLSSVTWVMRLPIHRSSRNSTPSLLMTPMVSAAIAMYEYAYTVWVEKIPPWGYLIFFSFFHKLLRILIDFTHLLYVPMYARLQIFIQLSPTLTKLCHIKRDNLVHIICSKCPPSAKTHAFRRLRKSLIALLIVVYGKSL